MKYLYYALIVIVTVLFLSGITEIVKGSGKAKLGIQKHLIQRGLK